MEERKIAEAQIESFCQYLIPVNFFYTTPKGGSAHVKALAVSSGIFTLPA